MGIDAGSRIRQQVAAILEVNGLEWTGHDDRLALRFDSAEVFIGFAPWGEQQVVTLHADVLTDLDHESSSILSVLKRMNALNETSTFGRWVYRANDRAIAIECELLGDHLQEPELMTALAIVARLADRHDDLLQAEFGGKKAFES